MSDIVFASYPPYVFPCVSGLLNHADKCQYPGIDFEIIRNLVLFAKLNNSLVWQNEPVNWGNLIANETYSGLLGEVHNGTIAAIGAQYFVDELRLKNGLQFTYPTELVSINTGAKGFIIQKPATGGLSLNASKMLISVLPSLVWACFGAIVLMLITYQWMANIFMSKILQFSKEKYFDQAVWSTFTLTVKQFDFSTHHLQQSSRLNVQIAGTLALVFATLYESVLLQHLINNPNIIPFKSAARLADLISSKQFKLVVSKGLLQYSMWEQIAHPETSLMLKLNKSLIKDPPLVTETDQEALEIIKKDSRYALIGIDFIGANFGLLAKECSLLFKPFEDLQGTTLQSFVWSKSDPGYEQINEETASNYAMIHYIEEKYIKHENSKKLKLCNPVVVPPYIPLKLAHFYGMFFAFAYLSALAVILFTIEFVVPRLLNATKNWNIKKLFRTSRFTRKFSFDSPGFVNETFRSIEI